MSRENVVEALRLAHDAFNHGLVEFIAFYTDDVELVPDTTWPDQGPFRGKDAARRWWEGIVCQFFLHRSEALAAAGLRES